MATSKKVDKKRYPASYLISDVELRPASSLNMFCVHVKEDGHLLYPYHPPLSVFGNSKPDCERWIKEYCAGLLDIAVKKKYLKVLAELGAGESLNDFLIVENNLVYEGNRHDDYRVIFNLSDVYYKFEYFTTHFGFSIGLWLSEKNVINDETYLCRKVKQKKEVVLRFV